MWPHLFLFAVALALIVKGGDLFVDSSVWIAEVSGMPRFLIGATIVSLATTLPEMLVSLVAAGHGQVEMAVGNAVGSVSANTALILAIALIIAPMAAPKGTFAKKSWLLIAAAVILPLASLTGQLATWGAIALAAIFCLFIWENIHCCRTDRSREPRAKPDRARVVYGVVSFLVGATWVVIGSHLLVSSGGSIATMLGVPERVIAVTLVAIGTSLPELVTTVTALAKRQGSLSAGNIIGANIIDLTLILPLCAMRAGGLPVPAQSALIDMPMCLAFVLIAILPTLRSQKFRARQGVTLLLLYTLYLTLTVL